MCSATPPPAPPPPLQSHDLMTIKSMSGPIWYHAGAMELLAGHCSYFRWQDGWDWIISTNMIPEHDHDLGAT